ncbi:RHS repeat domain-containing protein [Olleya namhaensis]|uniref:YD repeat-containing protein n=1 Tax=Olleya namhaensis TaxID=1144750 RepID=A0A1I3MTL5_9FLAO|nr:RHS repeat domain-containing protein [Olleya namhaensis]SFJ00454.1 YD repeat-containing protein [Olleya namhaensis]
MKPFLFLIVLIITFDVSSQNNPISEYVDHYSNVIPETPNAAAFMTYGNTSVNYSKGSPDISIPIYTMSIDGVSVPISISYDASGIKVDEMASVVGLKWRLNAGGGIFRAINNEPDEGNTGWTTNNWTSRDNDWYYDNPISFYGTQTYLMNNPIDHSPDSFSYNFGSYFGSFIFKRKDINTILKNSNDNLLITKGESEGALLLQSFLAKDVQGNTYNFGGSQDSRELNSNATINGSGNSISVDNQDYNSSWLLKNITSKNNRQLNFEYIEYVMDYTLFHRSQSIKRQNYKNPQGYSSGLSCAQTNSTGDASDGTYSYFKSTISTINTPKNKLVSKITSEKEEVRFIYQNHMPPFIPEGNNIWGKKLARIEVRNQINQEIIKVVNFVYNTYDGDPRLKLKEVNEENPLNGEIKSHYSFNYNDNYDLPVKQSYSRDYFGYYNGAPNASLLIPFSAQAYAKLPLLYKKQLADRRPYLEYLISGNLEEIIYPTGGKTTFEYELNTEQSEVGEYRYIKDQVGVDGQDFNYQVIGNKRVFSKPFTIPEHILNNSQLNNANIIVDSENDFSNCNSNEGLVSIDCSKYAIYERIGGQKGNQVGSDRLAGYDISLLLNPGDYFLELSVDESDYNIEPNLQINVNFKWVYNIEGANGELIREPHYTGGLRVKSIVDTNTDNTEFNKISFEYAGLKGLVWKEDLVNKTNDYNWTTSSEILAHNKLLKSGHFYEHVISKKGNEQDPLDIDPFFVQESHEQHFFFEQEHDNASFKGKKSKTFSYDSDNRLLTKEFYLYETDKHDNYYNILGELNYCYNTSSTTSGIGYGQPQNVNFAQFENRLIKSISTQYFYPQDSDLISGVITNANSYQYNSDELIFQKTDDYQLKENQNIDYYDQTNYSTDLNNRKIITSYTFPKGYQSNSILQNLVNTKNLLSIPISIIVSENGEKLQGSFLEYDITGNIKHLYSYNKGQGSNNSSQNYIPNNYDLNSTYSFDVFGNIKEVKKESGGSISYIWGYNSMYPVAKIGNASYAEIESILGNSFTLSVNGLTASQEAALRVGLPNAQISTYTYRPLIGVTSVTDPRGNTIYYDYDAFNRLKQVKDKDDNILSKNDYNYANQN